MTVILRRIVVLVDLSGTLHIEDTPTAGAVDALNRLLDAPDKYAVKFVTNTTKESVNNLHSRLRRCGFSRIEKSHIFSSLSAARRLVDVQNLRPMMFLEEEALEDFAGVSTLDPNAVVVGLSPSNFNFNRMNEAFTLLLKGHVPLIAIHKGRYYKRSDGLALGPGPFVHCLEYATGHDAIVVGKPEKTFYDEAVRSALPHGAEGTENVVMIGDDVRDDVNGALNAGMHAMLVKTGKYREGDERSVQTKPGLLFQCVDNFAAAVTLLEDGIFLRTN